MLKPLTRKNTALTKPFTIYKEQIRKRHHPQRQNPKQRGRPGSTEPVVHGPAEEREYGGEDTSREDGGAEGGGAVEGVRLHEEGEDAVEY